MEYYNRIVCATFEDLSSGPDAIMNLNTLRSLVFRNPSLRVRRSTWDKPVLIDYYALPERYRKLYEERHGDPKMTLKEEIRKANLRLDAKAREYFEGYSYEKGGIMTRLPENLIEEYTVNASVLNILWDRYNDCKAYRKSLSGSMSGVWDVVSDTSEGLRDSYGHTLPTSVMRLRERMNRYRKDGYASLISGKMGNRSAAVITDEAARLIVALKRSSVPVYTDAQLLEKYNEEAKARGWKQLSGVRALSMFLNKPEIMPLWYDAVYGELKAHQYFSRKNRTELPSVRDALWYGDGTKLNLYYRATEGGRTVIKTMQVYEVMDAYSEVLLGYHISESENYEAQYHAYRMAVQMSGHKPYELVCDNQGGHKKLEAQNFFKKICRVYRPTAPYSGQSKTIESAFGRFQSQVLHKDWRFTGQNITAKRKSSRANLERVSANMDKLYTLEELKQAYAAARREWNEGRHPATGQSRIEMYRASENPETDAVGVMDMIDMFWLRTERLSTYTDNGLRITVKGKVYEYEVFGDDGLPDHGFLRTNFGRKFQVAYDPYDMRSVRLYTRDADGSLRFARIAETRMVIHRAIQEQREGEAAFIRSQIEANRQDRLERQAQARAIEREFGTSPEQQGLARAKLAGISGGQAAVEREIERRAKKYSRSPEVVSPGELGKKISEMIYNPQTGGIDIDECRVAGKL